MFLNKLIKNLDSFKNSNSFCIKDRFYTYEDLKNTIIKIQSILSNLPDVKENEPFAILCTDDFQTYSALLSLWFRGNCYVPLGLHNPDHRNLSILKDAEIRYILSTSRLDASIYSGFTIIYINELDIDRPTDKIQLRNFDFNNLSYILFTSGSTGQPKGVPITFNNLASFIDAFLSSPFEVTPEDKTLQMFELTFDVSISSFLPSLLAGACIFTVPNDVLKYVHVLKLINKYQLTVIQIVPSIIRLSISLLPKFINNSVKLCILTGEATHADLIYIWRKSFLEAKIYNFYGPTEATVYCSFFDCNSQVLNNNNGLVSIGKAFNGMELIIIDDDKRIVSQNEKGELLISGPQVTNGYLNNSEKNKLSFISLEINGTKKRFYKSGDLCYKDKDENILYCGRLDSQVKINGFRIELGEIEITVREFLNINNIIIPKETKNGTMELILVLESESAENMDQLINYLKSRLPDYMVPAKIKYIPTFPLNSSGKTNKEQIKLLINE